MLNIKLAVFLIVRIVTITVVKNAQKNNNFRNKQRVKDQK